MAKTFHNLSTGKGNPDFRSPQEKGKPAHTANHAAVGRDPGEGTRQSAFHNIPNRSGAVKNNVNG